MVRAKVAIAAMPTTSEIRAKRGGAAGYDVRIGGSGRVSGSGGRQCSNRSWAAAPLSIGPSSIENAGQSAAWSEDDGKPGVCKASTKKMGSGTSGAQLPTPCSASTASTVPGGKLPTSHRTSCSASMASTMSDAELPAACSASTVATVPSVELRVPRSASMASTEAMAAAIRSSLARHLSSAVAVCARARRGA